MSNIAIQFGQRIRQLRSAQKISQEELAFKSGISAAHLGQIERGVKKPTIETIGKISSALNIALSELFSFGEVPTIEATSSIENKIIAQLSDLTPEQKKDILKLIKVFKHFKKEF